MRGELSGICCDFYSLRNVLYGRYLLKAIVPSGSRRFVPADSCYGQARFNSARDRRVCTTLRMRDCEVSKASIVRSIVALMSCENRRGHLDIGKCAIKSAAISAAANAAALS